jgi:hypothetical protein
MGCRLLAIRAGVGACLRSSSFRTLHRLHFIVVVWSKRIQRVYRERRDGGNASGLPDSLPRRGGRDSDAGTVLYGSQEATSLPAIANRREHPKQDAFHRNGTWTGFSLAGLWKHSAGSECPEADLESDPIS